MIDSKTLGNRIRYFRKCSGMSQLELEMEIGASAGMLSRIESGKVNPSKETVRKIVECLGMNNRELDYIVGVTALPANQSEIKKAVNSISKYFSRNDVFAYLIDERWRLITCSKNIKRLYRIFNVANSIQIENSYMQPLLNIFLSKNGNVGKAFKTSKYEDFLYFQFQRFHKEVGYMFDDVSYINVVKRITADRFYKKIWDRAISESMKSNSYMAKQVRLKLLGREFDLQYSREFLSSNPRFETIEVFPHKKFANLIRREPS